MKKKYTEERVVSCYEADSNHNFRPTAMLDLMQEAAGRDASVLGVGPFENEGMFSQMP